MASCVFSAARARLDVRADEGVGVRDEGIAGNDDDSPGSTVAGGVRDPDLCEAAESSRVNDVGSSSSSSVNTFNSPGVKVAPAAIDRLFG